jgi:hypothetical protein
MTASPPDLSVLPYQNQAIAWDDEAVYGRDLAAWATWARKRALEWAQPRPWAATSGGDPAMALVLLQLSARITAGLAARRVRQNVKRSDLGGDKSLRIPVWLNRPNSSNGATLSSACGSVVTNPENAMTQKPKSAERQVVGPEERTGTSGEGLGASEEVGCHA